MISKQFVQIFKVTVDFGCVIQCKLYCMYVCVNVRMRYNRVIQSKLSCNLVKVIKREATIQYQFVCLK